MYSYSKYNYLNYPCLSAVQSSLGTTGIDTNDKLFTNQARVVSTASWFLTPVDKINPALFGMQASCQIIF